MKNKLTLKAMFRIAGFIAIVAVIGFMAVACDIPADELDGTTWKGTVEGVTVTFTFNSPNFTSSVVEGGITTESGDGEYSISGSTVTLKFSNGFTRTAELSGGKLIYRGLTLTKQ